MNASSRNLISSALCGLALCVGCVLAQEPGSGFAAGSNDSSGRPSVEAEAEAVARGNERNRALLNEGAATTVDSEVANVSRSTSALSGSGQANASSALSLRGVKHDLQVLTLENFQSTHAMFLVWHPTAYVC